MMLKYDPLLAVYFRHKYFANDRFTRFQLTPSDASVKLMKRFGLVIKMLTDGFKMLYENPFSESGEGRQALLKENITLHFRIDLSDFLFYNYTGYMPEDTGNKIFFFTNQPKQQRLTHIPNLLHHYRFVTEKEIVNMNEAAWEKGPKFSELYFSKPFGHLELKLTEDLQESMYICFFCRFTFWRYLLASDYLQQRENLLVVNKTRKWKFIPEGFTVLPDGRKVQAFISKKAIAVTQAPNRSFQLGENYDAVNNRFQKEIMPVLPNPDTNVISKIADKKNVIKKNISNIVI